MSTRRSGGQCGSEIQWQFFSLLSVKKGAGSSAESEGAAKGNGG